MINLPKLAIWMLLLPGLLQAQSTIHTQSLDSLFILGEQSHSDAIVVYQNGTLVKEWFSETGKGKIHLVSATKSVTALIILELVGEGKIRSLDIPIHEFYPEWNQGNKKNITIRHLLNHTSGLQETWEEIGVAPDEVQLALCAELSDIPGTRFRYNSKAPALLAGIVEKVTGRKMDAYSSHLFVTLSIEAEWLKDQAGTPNAAGGLKLSAHDFAKIGQLVINKGRWNGEQLIKPELIDEMLKPGQGFNDLCGLLWWRLPENLTYSIDKEKLKTSELFQIYSKNALQKMRKAKHPYFKTRDECFDYLKAFGFSAPEADAVEKIDQLNVISRNISAKIVGYYAQGGWGQHLVILPEHNIVAVRLKNKSADFNWSTDYFDDFPERTYKLIK